MKLRHYQEDLIRRTVHALKKDDYISPLVVGPTGCGKTIIFSFIATNAEKKDKRVLILTHRREILQQTLDKLYLFGIQAGQVASGQPMTNELIQVAMVGTIVRRLDKIIPPDLIIIDECHHSTSNTWKTVLNHFNNVIRIGFTATPQRADGKGLIEIFDTLIEGPTLATLVKEGFLSYPRMFCGPNVKVKSKKRAKITRGDYDKKEQTQIMSERIIIGNVIEHYREKLNGLPTVCFCVSIEHCETMEEEFRQSGYRAKTVHGKMNKKERYSAIEGLSTGEVQILCSCDVISEGVDVPVIAGAILLRRTKSLSLYLQQVGRALRPYPGKTEAIILDHSGVIHEHGHVLLDRNWSLYGEDKKKKSKSMALPEVTICQSCSAVWPGLPAICPDCGANLNEQRDKMAGRKLPREIEGVLKEVMPDENEQLIKAMTAQADEIQRMSPADRQQAMLANLHRHGDSPRVKGLAEAVGYKKDWTKITYEKLYRR